VELRREQLDLARLVRSSAEDHRAAAESLGLTLTIDVPETPVWVRADNTRLAQILDNLLSNASKFTSAKGRVEVRVATHAEKQEAVLSVHDTGIGIKPEDLPHVFQSFYQADRSLDRQRGGLGLGLALVKGLAELHGGRVEAASPGPDQGSTFLVWLPLLGEPPLLGNTKLSPLQEKKQGRVLVIEDNRDAAETLRVLLQGAGYEVSVAHSGTEGVEVAKRVRPQIVLCDIGLPGMDGFAVAGELRRDAATSKARLIAVTGYGREEDRRQAIAAGFDDHVTKPADFENLIRKLDLPESCD
jgi:CheY-like chemotaxis protein/two-component sensor histidine kinase